MTAVVGDPASCSRLGGSLRRIAAGLRKSGAGLHRELEADPASAERPSPVLQRSRRRAATVDRTTSDAARVLDEVGTALQGHAADLAETIAASRDLAARAEAAGLHVTDDRVGAAWGVAGVADAEASAARDDRRDALQRELDQLVTVLAHRRARLGATLRTATTTLAHHAEELRR